MICECDTVTMDRPSARDPYQPAEQRVPDPRCPVHRESDDEVGVDWDAAADYYRIARTNAGEWIDETDIDPDTGDRKEPS